jgi:hypothetical protein
MGCVPFRAISADAQSGLPAFLIGAFVCADWMEPASMPVDRRAGVPCVMGRVLPPRLPAGLAVPASPLFFYSRAFRVRLRGRKYFAANARTPKRRPNSA